MIKLRHVKAIEIRHPAKVDGMVVPGEENVSVGLAGLQSFCSPEQVGLRFRIVAVLHSCIGKVFDFKWLEPESRRFHRRGCTPLIKEHFILRKKSATKRVQDGLSRVPQSPLPCLENAIALTPQECIESSGA